MKPSFLSLLFVLFLTSCASQYPRAEDPMDAAREFIDASLKGDFDKANAYVLHNDANDKTVANLIADYRSKSSEQKQQYHDASLNILEEDTVSDSVHIINYKNSFDNIARKVKVVNTKDGWLVDVSYIFNGNL